MSEPTDATLEPVRWLYITNWYDGPIEGVVLHNGERLYAKWTDVAGDDPNGRRIYDAIRLTPEQWAEEDDRQACFVEHVGTHWCCDYDADGNQIANWNVRPQSEHHNFYDKYPANSPRNHDGERVGVFTG